jgi:hypothetical protein
VHEGPAFLLAIVLCRGAADKETAVQMNRDNREPVVGAHAVEDAVAQDASVIDHCIDATEVVQRSLDDLLRRTPFSDRVGADLGLTAILTDDPLGLLRGGDGRSAAGERSPDIVDDHLGTGSRHHDGDLAPDAATGTGDYDDLAFHHACHGHNPLCCSVGRLTARTGSRNVNSE